MVTREAELVATDKESRLDEMERAVSRCHRSLSRQRLLMGSMGVLLSGMLLASAAREETVIDDLRVKNLSVVDNEGKVRIVAGTLPDGNAALRWFDSDGKGRLYAGTTREGSGAITWIDPEAKIRMFASTGSDGNAGMWWFDCDEKGRIAVGTDAKGLASVRWFDRDDKVRIAAGTTENGDAGITLNGKLLGSESKE